MSSFEHRMRSLFLLGSGLALTTFCSGFASSVIESTPALGTGAEVLARPLALISSRHGGGFGCRGERKGGREEDEKMRVREGEMRRLRLRGEARRGRKEESEGELCNKDVTPSQNLVSLLTNAHRRAIEHHLFRLENHYLPDPQVPSHIGLDCLGSPCFFSERRRGSVARAMGTERQAGTFFQAPSQSTYRC